MLSAGEAGALVAGGASAPSAADATDVRVVRAVLWDGAVRQPGEIVRIADRRQARELVAAGKVEMVPPAAEAAAADAPPAKAEPRRRAKEPDA